MWPQNSESAKAPLLVRLTIALGSPSTRSTSTISFWSSAEPFSLRLPRSRSLHSSVPDADAENRSRPAFPEAVSLLNSAQTASECCVSSRNLRLTAPTEAHAALGAASNGPFQLDRVYPLASLTGLMAPLTKAAEGQDGATWKSCTTPSPLAVAIASSCEIHAAVSVGER